MSTEHFLTEAEIKVIDSATKTLQQINNSFKELGLGVKNQKEKMMEYGAALKTIGVQAGVTGAAILAGAGFAVKAAGDQARADAQLEAVIKSTGGAAGMTAEEVKKMAGALQNVTDYSDETIQSGQNMLLTFTNIHKDVFPRATKAMLDMSTAMGTDLKGTAIQLGKALNDPIQGIQALSRVGVQFTQAQKDVIKTLVETGRGMEAQKMILQELEKEFGGSAEAVSTPMMQLKNQINEVQEALGAALLPTVRELTNAVLPHVKALAAWMTENQALVGLIAKVTVVLGGVLVALSAVSLTIATLTPLWAALGVVLTGTVIPALGATGVAIAALMGPIGIIIAGVAAIVAVHQIGMAKVEDAWNKAAKSSNEQTTKMTDDYNRWSTASGLLTGNEQKYAQLRTTMAYHMAEAVRLSEAQIEQYRMGGSKAAIAGFQEQMDFHNKKIKEAGDAALKFADTHAVSMDKVKSTYASVGAAAKSGFNQGNDAAEGAKDKLSEVKKAIEDLEKSYWSSIVSINRKLLEMKATHKTTMDGLTKDLATVNADIQKLGSEFTKATAQMLEAHNKTMDGLSDDKGNSVIETYKKVLDLQQQIKDNSGKEDSINAEKIVTVIANRQDKGDTLSARDQQAFGVSDTGASQINDIIKLKKEQEGLTKVLQENYNLSKEQADSLKNTYGEAQLGNIQKIIAANKELTKASDFGNLTDLQKQFVGFSKTATEETKSFAQQQTEKNQNYTEELGKLKLTRQELQKKMDMETTVYTNTRAELLNTKISMQDFHNTYTQNLLDVDKVTKETVDAMKTKLEELKNTIAGIDALMKSRAELTGGQTVTDKAKNTNVKRSANGNVFTSPDITMVAEGQYAEAVVPLPDGRSIPVDMKVPPASQSNSVTINMGGVVIKNDVDINTVARKIVAAVDNQLLKAR
jgi:flagellar motor switch/type III secretory pathway protein FliN